MPVRNRLTQSGPVSHCTVVFPTPNTSYSVVQLCDLVLDRITQLHNSNPKVIIILKVLSIQGRKAAAAQVLQHNLVLRF